MSVPRPYGAASQEAAGIGKFTCSNYSLLRDSDLDGVDCQERSAMRPIGLDYFLEAAESVRGMGFGAVAQLGERLICIQEVAGSIPTSSTSFQHMGL